MEAWSRFRNSFSSLPTTTSPSSSSTSLHPHLLFDLADELWFYGSVVPLPSLSLPCLPALFSPPSPDPSTLLVQCMITDFTFSRRPNSDQQNWGLPHRQAYPDSQENCGNTRFCAENEDACHDYNETVYGGLSSLSDSDEDEDADWALGNAADDEEAYHYDSAPSDWDDDDAYNGDHVPSDDKDESVKEEVLPADCPSLHANVEPVDDIYGVYDATVLLKDQHLKRTQEVSYPLVDREVALLVSGLAQIQLPLLNEQGDTKENIKLWAHTVALALPWKAAAEARSFI